MQKTRKREYGGTASSSKKKDAKYASNACTDRLKVELDLPHDAADRWIGTAHMKASNSMLRKHGGDYLDTRSSKIPAPRAISQKLIRLG